VETKFLKQGGKNKAIHETGKWRQTVKIRPAGALPQYGVLKKSAKEVFDA